MASGFMTATRSEGVGDTVRIEENDRVLMELIFARAAWGIDAAPHLPTVLRSPVRPMLPSAPLPFAVPADEWTHDWEDRLKTIREGNGTFPGRYDPNPHAFNEWRAQQPPSWSEKVGSVWPTQAYAQWLADLFEDVPRRELRDDPEHRAEDLIRAASARGLRVILVLPLADAFAESASSTLLLVSSATRDRENEYARALRTHT